MEIAIFQTQRFPVKRGLGAQHGERQVCSGPSGRIHQSLKPATQAARSPLLQMATPASQGQSLSHTLKRVFGEVSLG